VQCGLAHIDADGGYWVNSGCARHGDTHSPGTHPQRILGDGCRGRSIPFATGVFLTAGRHFRGIADVAGPCSLPGPVAIEIQRSQDGRLKRDHYLARGGRRDQISRSLGRADRAGAFPPIYALSPKLFRQLKTEIWSHHGQGRPRTQARTSSAPRRAGGPVPGNAALVARRREGARARAAPPAPPRVGVPGEGQVRGGALSNCAAWRDIYRPVRRATNSPRGGDRTGRPLGVC
jgi:hypothetical protein